MTTSPTDLSNPGACPVCGKTITGDPRQCSHCGAIFELKSPHLWNRKLAGFLGLVFPGAGQIYKMKILIGILWMVGVIFGYRINILLGLSLHALSVLHAMWGDTTA